MDKQQALQNGYEQLAVDYNARPEDFRREGVIFTQPAMNPGRRAYSREMPFFEMVTVGRATVIMADDCLGPALDDWAKGAEEAHWLLEFPRMLKLAGILAPYGYELTQTFHQYLPAGDFGPVDPPGGLALRLIECGDIQNFFPNTVWPNALQDEENPDRPDVLALAALDGDKIAGMAGASMDAPKMWQIGIDVRKEYRGRGLATLLVRGLAHEVERRGAMPFYGTSLSNIHSQNIARNAGFFPAWVSVSAKKKG